MCGCVLKGAYLLYCMKIRTATPKMLFRRKGGSLGLINSGTTYCNVNL